MLTPYLRTLDFEWVRHLTQIRGDEELPRAYVVLKDHARHQLTEKELGLWISERVAKHKRLTGGVVFVRQIPKSPTGKIQRKRLKELAHEEQHSVVRSRL